MTDNTKLIERLRACRRETIASLRAERDQFKAAWEAYCDSMVEMEKRYDEARQDTALLDWMESQPPPVVLRIARTFRDDDMNEDANIRRAIRDAQRIYDAARSEESS